MCGISLVAAAISTSEQQSQDYVKRFAVECETALRSRGPDHYGSQQVLVPSPAAATADPAAAAAAPTLLLHLAASLLQLRGDRPSTSPLTDVQGNILCFNGEIFGGLDLPEGGNDGKYLFTALGALSEVTQVPELMSQLRGPWSIIYWQQAMGTLWFGRDWLGRRSLLLRRSQSSCQRSLVLSSVAPVAAAAGTAAAGTGDNDSGSSKEQCSWIEVPPGLYSITSTDLLRHLSGSTESSNSSSSSKSCEQLQHAVKTSDASAAASIAAMTAAAAGDEVEDAEAANGGITAPEDLCSAVQGLCHHAWVDMQLLQLQQYARAEYLIPATPTQAEQQQQQQQQPAQDGVDVAQQQQQQPAQDGVDVAQQQQQHDESDSAMPSMQTSACQSVLQLLQAAVNTRCWTINTLQQHMQHSCFQQQQQQQQQQHASSAIDLERKLQLQSGMAQQPVITAAATAATTAVGQDLQSLLPPSPILILFSGGVDSTLIAALAHLALPADVPIDLSNVCFVNGASPDRQAAHSALLELAAFAPERQWRLIEVDSSLEEVDQYAHHIKGLLHPAGTVMDLNIGAALWLAARAEGQQVLMPMAKDSPAAAAAAAGGNNDTASAGSSSSGTESAWCLVPALCAVSPAATPPGQAVAAPTTEQAAQHTQANGSSSSSSGVLSRRYCYKSAARVVLLGHGADEQCGGYGRHRTAFRHLGWQGLADELAVDVKRLWIRNLGRDDRLVADHAREARHPFLDEALMTALLNMPLQLLANVSKARGVGDKHILRGILSALGIPLAASREKRAIQFGSRIGKLSNRREFGSNRRANLMSAGQVQIHKLPNMLQANLKQQQQHSIQE